MRIKGCGYRELAFEKGYDILGIVKSDGLGLAIRIGKD